MNAHEVAPSRTIEWVGAGRPAFLGNAGAGPESRPVEVLGPGEFRSAFGDGVTGDPAFRQSVEDYFAHGGCACHVVHLPGVDRLPEDRAAALLLGEDGGPGYRTGLHGLSDVADVGVISAPGLVSARCREVLVEYGKRRSSRAVVLEADLGTRPPDALLRRASAAPKAPDWGTGVRLIDRLVWLPHIERGAGTVLSRLPAGPSLALLERQERQPVVGSGPAVPIHRDPAPALAEGLVAAIAAGLPTVGERFGSLRLWRLWEGIRRSIDAGTRWVLFELQDEFLSARVEREVSGFLYRLEEAGVLDRARSGRAFDVRCELTVQEKNDGPLGKMAIRVRLRLPPDAGRVRTIGL